MFFSCCQRFSSSSDSSCLNFPTRSAERKLEQEQSMMLLKTTLSYRMDGVHGPWYGLFFLRSLLYRNKCLLHLHKLYGPLRARLINHHFTLHHLLAQAWREIDSSSTKYAIPEQYRDKKIIDVTEPLSLFLPEPVPREGICCLHLLDVSFLQFH